MSGTTTTATPAQKQIDKVTISGTVATTDTYTIYYNGISVTSGTPAAATAAAAAAVVAAALNQAAGANIATTSGADVIITASDAGGRLPSFGNPYSGAYVGYYFVDKAAGSSIVQRGPVQYFQAEQVSQTNQYSYNDTLNSTDKIDGGAGTDTIKIESSGSVVVGDANVSNVEVLEIKSQGSAQANVENWDANLSTVNLTGTSGYVTTKSNVTNVNFTGVNGSYYLQAFDNAAGTAAEPDKLATVTASGVSYLNIHSDALTTLNLTKQGDVAVQAAAGTRTITLNANEMNGDLSDGEATAAVVNTSGSKASDIGLAIAKAKTLTVNAGSTATDGTTISNPGSGYTALTAVTSTGAGKLTADFTSATKLATITATAATGAQNLTIGAVTKTVALGSGNDTLTLAATMPAGTNVNLGGGDDKLLSASGAVTASTTAATTVIDGGDGSDSVAASLVNAANAAVFKNFEQIDASEVATLDVELVTGSTITGLTLSGGAGGAVLSNVAAGVGLTVTGVNTGITTVGVKGATLAASAADSFAATFAGKATAAATATVPDAVDAGTLIVKGVETFSVVSGGTGFVANTLVVKDATALQTLAISGDKKLTLTFAEDGTTAFNGTAPTSPTETVNGVKLIDGSSATGVLDINTTNITNIANAGLTVKTGAGKDVITLAQKATVDAGAGDDTITSAAAGGSFTGGAGNDKFAVALAVATGATAATAVYATITDAAVGDSIKLLGGNTIAAATLGAKTALTTSVTTLDLALGIAALTDTANEVSWFQYGTNTYIVANDGIAGFAAGDLVVKLTGLVDLTNATLDTTTDYLTIV